MECDYSMYRGAACAIGTVAYFNPGGVWNMYSYDYQQKQWSELEQCCVRLFALAVISDLLTTVGGEYSNKLFSYIEGKWVERFSRMSTERMSPAAVCTGHYLVVAGGHSGSRTLATVEVMDTNTNQWLTAATLPRGVHRASMSACGDYLYIFGDHMTHVQSCSIEALLQSCRAPGKASLQGANVWKRIEDLPVSNSTAATLCGQLISVGGGKNDSTHKDIYYYDPPTATWKFVGKIPSAIYCGSPLITTLPGDKIIIVDGLRHITISVASAIMG